MNTLLLSQQTQVYTGLLTNLSLFFIWLSPLLTAYLCVLVSSVFWNTCIEKAARRCSQGYILVLEKQTGL